METGPFSSLDPSRQGLQVLVEDQVLVTRIARDRDQEAFEVLMKRHHRASLSLAFFISRDRDLAEESLQQAYLNLWLHAAKFKAGANGSARAWLLRLVANEAIRLGRRQGRERQRVARMARYTGLGEGHERESSQERDELSSVLSAHLASLTSAERELVGLYFGVGISHREIAEHFSISPQLVAYRLKKILDILRVKLASQGQVMAPMGAIPEWHANVQLALLTSLAPLPSEFEQSIRCHCRRAAATGRWGLVSGGLRWPCWALLCGVAFLSIVGAFGWGPISSDPTPPARTGGPWTAVEEAALSQSDAVPSRVSVAGSARMPLEVVYEDQFDGPRLASFWEQAVPSPQRGLATYFFDMSNLIMVAGSRKEIPKKLSWGRVDPANLAQWTRVAPSIALASRLIPVSPDRFLLFEFGPVIISPPKGLRFQWSLQVLGPGGEQLVALVYFRFQPGDPLARRTLIGKGSASDTRPDRILRLEAHAIDGRGGIWRFDTAGQRWFQMANGQAPLGAIRIRLALESTEDWVFVRINQARVLDCANLPFVDGPTGRAPELRPLLSGPDQTGDGD